MSLLIDRLNKAAMWVMISMLIALAAMLVVFSILVRDLAFPRAHPFLFTIETVSLAVIPAMPIFLLAHFRRVPTAHAWLLFGSLAAKLLVAHLLFQFSGFYTWSMPSRVPYRST